MLDIVDYEVKNAEFGYNGVFFVRFQYDGKQVEVEVFLQFEDILKIFTTEDFTEENIKKGVIQLKKSIIIFKYRNDTNPAWSGFISDCHEMFGNPFPIVDVFVKMI